jgi:ABC-type transport system substrate-binding protein
MRKRKLLTAILALSLFVPWNILPVAAQLDATPELAFELWVLSWDDISVDTGGAIRTLLADIGIDITVVIKDDDPMYEGIYQEPRAFALYEMSHGYGSVPDHVWYRMHSENIIDWGSNCYGLNNATMDAALDDFMTSTPAELEENARLVQLYATQNIPYIPLFLSDDTHAIRSEWTNYTKKPGGVFTSFNPQTMIFMYDDTWTSGDMEFVMAYGSDIGELNPIFYRSERSHWYDMLVYDTLISFDENLEPIPWLAEDWDISADGTTVNFTIRSGVTWHDGEPLDAEDVAFSFNYWKNAPEDANYWSFLQHMESATADGDVVSVVMDDAWSFVLQILGHEVYILPQHIREGVDADDDRWDDATNVTAHTGSGPFKFVSRTPDEFTDLERNDDWWGPDNPYVGQLPSITDVRIDVVRGQDARILAMRNGEADSERYEVFGPYVTTILDAPELDLVTGVTSQWDYVLGFNTTATGFDDLNVRRAISYAMDREYLVNVGRLGFGTATNSTIPGEFFPALYDDDGVFVEDVDMANDILDAAGYLDVDNDGVREFPGVAPPAPGVDLVLIGGVGAVALIVGVLVTYLLLKKK